jgi:hypothetical protein
VPGAAPETSGRLERRSDLSSRVLARKRDARTGALHVRAPLTWIGVREYRRSDGTISRELRRPEQVRSESHLAALRRLTATADHPSAEYRGRQLPVTLWVGAREDGAPERDGTLRRPPAMFAVGHTGDSLELVEVDGEDLPVAWITVTDEGAAQDIEAGSQETSLGYGALIVPAPPGSTWTDSKGREWAYDAEHVLDISDPRVLEAAKRGDVDPEEIGPNHFAVAIRRGRGGVMSRLLDSFVSPRRDFPEVSDPRLTRALEGLARAPWEIPPLDSEHPAQVADVHRFASDAERGLPTWWGWSEGETEGVNWIAFWGVEVDWYTAGAPEVRPSGLGLLWTARAEDGSVQGDPVRIRRAPERQRLDEACPSGQPSPGARGDHYPHGVLFKISPKARKLAAALGKVQGVTLAPKADAVECTIPDNVPGAALAEFFASMSAGEAEMLDEAGMTQEKLGAAEANLAALTDKVEALKPFKLVGKRLQRDAAVVEAQKLGLKADALASVAAPKDAAKDLEPATPAQVRRAAVVAKLGDSYKDASEDRVTGAYAALLAQVAAPKPAPLRDAKDEIPDPPSPDSGRQERRDRSKDPDPNPPALLPIANLG